ncbi:hypothetical protein HAX54_048662, partial [Datura stramonium]|nr:hypothetical protein [Datura stramonium]
LPHQPDIATLQVGAFYIYSCPASRRLFTFTVALPTGGLSISQLPHQVEACFLLQVASLVEAYTTATQYIRDLSVTTVYANQEQLCKSELTHYTVELPLSSLRYCLASNTKLPS